jgi:hypothetical protein
LKRIWVVVCCLFALVACSDEPTPPEPSVSHPKAEVPKDRDHAAVLAAVQRLDPCALLDGALPGSQPTVIAPFTCRIAVGQSGGLSVKILELSTETRLITPTEPFEGMRSYRNIQSGACAVQLPISFRLAVEIVAVVDGDSCALADVVAGQVVTRLDDPEQVGTEPRWDACSVLAGALDVTVADVESSPGFDLGKCDSDDATLFFWAIGEDEELNETDTVGGTPVVVETGDRCSVSWRAGPELLAKLEQSDCGAAKETAGRAMAVLGTPPPDTAPQRPLLYAWDEPDVPFPGACRYDRSPECQPYVEVPVPDGTAEIVRHAVADPNVSCAVSVDVVTERFGDELAPTTSGGSCDYHSPEKRLSVRIVIGDQPLDAENWDDTDVGGRAAKVELHEAFGQLRVALAEEPSAGSVLGVSLRALPRENETPMEIDEQLLREVAEALLDRHFD